MPARRLRPSLETAHQFLRALDFGDNTTAAHWFQTYDESGNERKPLICSLYGSLSDHAPELMRLNAAGAGVHVVVNLTDGQGKATENITEPRACFIDFDNVEPDFAAFPLPPSVVVRSAHGPHVYWMLQRGESLQRWSHLQLLVAEKHDGDLKTRKLARLQRLPGFLHCKAEPVEVGIEAIAAPMLRYTLAEIAEAWELTQRLREAEAEEDERERRAEERRRAPKKPQPRTGGPTPLERARMYIDNVPGAPQGDRNDHTSKHVASAGYDFDIDLDTWTDEVIAWNDHHNNPPLPLREVVSLVRSTYRTLQRKSKDPPGWKLTEDSPEWKAKQAEYERKKQERETADEAVWAARLANEGSESSGRRGGGGGSGGGSGEGGGGGGEGDGGGRGGGDDGRSDWEREEERRRAADMQLVLDKGVEAILQQDLLTLPCIATPPSLDGYPLTTRGNVMRVLADHRPVLRHCPPLAMWFLWDGARWKKDEPGYVSSLVTKRMTAMHKMLKNEKVIVRKDDDDQTREDKANLREAIHKHITKSERVSAINEVVEMLSWQPTCKVMTDKLDSHDHLVNTPSGTVDIRTLEQHRHKPAEYHTMVTRAPFDAKAECPTWVSFLEWAMCGDKEMVGFLQRACGYTSTGWIREQVFFLNYGTGRNGKSTFLNTLVYCLGDYATHCDIELFMLSKAQASANAANEEMLALRGARMVYAFEPNEGRTLMESRIKQVTGGEPITARPLYGRPVTFRPNFCLWLATNHRPVIRGTDDGIWRRVLLIPWRARVADADKDEELPRKLERESTGIVKWILEGARQWHQAGLGVPGIVRESTASYREEMDVIGTFIEQCCVRRTGSKVASSKLYDVFKFWCEKNGEGTWKQRTFKERLREHGVDCYKSNGIMTFDGIEVAPNVTLPSEQPYGGRRDLFDRD